jgi:hypothetical protein
VPVWRLKMAARLLPIVVLKAVRAYQLNYPRWVKIIFLGS